MSSCSTQSRSFNNYVTRSHLCNSSEADSFTAVFNPFMSVPKAQIGPWKASVNRELDVRTGRLFAAELETENKRRVQEFCLRRRYVFVAIWLELTGKTIIMSSRLNQKNNNISLESPAPQKSISHQWESKTEKHQAPLHFSLDLYFMPRPSIIICKSGFLATDPLIKL